MLPLSWIYNMVFMKWHIFAHKQLANITMNQKSIEHIALYSLVLVGTLVVGVLARQFVLSKGVDDFSSIVAFFAAVIVLMAIYASLQTTFNQFLLPRIETFLLRFSAFQKMKITMIPFLSRKPLQSKIQTRLRLMSLSLLLPLKKQSLNLQNMKSCEPTLSQNRIMLFKPN